MTVYVVVDAGDAIGLAILGSSSPVVGDQLYVVPPLADSWMLPPLHISTSAPASAVTFSVEKLSSVQPVASPAAL